ncbi:MAG: cytochrome c [Deltaproteobacteria bacterium]|nr:cytochrome c [Deltaproteobacteria bacterium]
MRKKILAVAAAVSLFVPVISEAADLEIRGIMKKLGSRTEEVVRGISAGDFKLIEKNALLLADHEKPPISERLRILGFLKTDASGFKAIDEGIHENAAKLAEAAQKQDQEAVLTHFSEVLKSCVKCHTQYRGRIIEHFYKEEKN